MKRTASRENTAIRLINGRGAINQSRNSMLNVFERAFRAAADVATLPVSVAADVATLGGSIIDRDEPYTVTKAKRLASDALDGVKALAE